MVKILYINSDGSSYGQVEQVPDNTTLAQFVRAKTGRGGDEYMIRVNGQIATADHVLAEGERLSLIPKKVAGASQMLQMAA